MDSIHFIPVSADNLRAFVEITHETLWHPVWPGTDAVAQDFRRWPTELQQATRLIYCGRELIGRVVMPKFEDYLIIRDLGVRDGHTARVVAALLQRAQDRRARAVRAIVYEPLADAFAALGFAEQKRRVTMHCELCAVPAPPTTLPLSCVPANLEPDGMDIGELLHEAYRGTVDDEGEGCGAWTVHARDVMLGRYGQFLGAASFVTPPAPPFHCATLVIESAPRCALLGQVVTRHSHVNRGYARNLITASLVALAALGYQACFLEATTTNANALHLYRALGFHVIGPQIVYGIKHLW